MSSDVQVHLQSVKEAKEGIIGPGAGSAPWPKSKCEQCRLVSRNRNAFASFQDLALRIVRLFPHNRVMLNGEIGCLDERGLKQI